MSHTPPIFINHGKNSSAFLTLDKPTSLVVFVHGFNGKATGTWDDFPALIRSKNDFANADVIFYGYDSMKGQANNNALKFYNFLTSVCENSPNKLGFNRDSINDQFRYENVVVIAHSLGAIVVRRALLTAKNENKSWLENFKMILFAPAHCGARVQKIILESLPIVGRLLAGLVLVKVPIIDDLGPQSQAILNLISDSKSYLGKDSGQFTIAHKVIWADNEIVVHNDQFCSDPAPILIDKKSHTSVCKPTATYLDPYEIVINAL